MMYHKFLYTEIAGSIAVFFFVLSCCSIVEVDNPPGVETRSSLSRDLSPQVTTGDIGQLAEKNTQFAVDFYREIVKTDEGNVFFSPYSISLATVMAYAGARGNTEIEIADTFYFPAHDDCHPVFNALDLLLLTFEGSEEEFTLDIVNSIWGQKDYVFLESYLDVLALNYGAGIFRLDFQNQPEKCRGDINEWVSKKTRERIDDLLPPGSISPLTRLVLTNAIYFKADWISTFDREKTHDAPFNLQDGTIVMVPTMNQSNAFAYTEAEGYYQAIELVYRGDKVAMIVILPAMGRFEELQKDLSVDFLNDLLAQLSEQNVDLSFPKTTFEWGQSLSDILSHMGMVDAFTAAANFSGIDGTRSLFISEIIHKAFVAIDEKGTEAAAATAVIMELTAAPLEGIRMNIDRPFIFLIRDRTTGTLLFLGHVVDPA